MWATEDIAIRHLKSVCRRQESDAYTIEIAPIAIARGANSAVASGRIGISTRRIPYEASFNTSPASTIEPAAGASTCARLSQMWKGTRGVLIANDRKIPSHRIFCVSNDRSTVLSVSISVVPVMQYRDTNDSSINSDPNSVYRNNRKLARTRAGVAPQIPTIRNSGINTASKATQKATRSSTTNTRIVNDSNTRNEIINDLILCCTFSQLARIQNGSVNVVRITKYSDSPSTPNRSDRNPGCAREPVDTNWYPPKLESNCAHIITDRNHVSRVVSNAVRLIRDVSAAVESCIVVSTSAPRIGKRIRVISILVI